MEFLATLLLCLISLCNIGRLISEPVSAVAFSSAHSSFASAASASAGAGGACFEEPDNDYDTPASSYNDDNDDCTQKDPESEEYYCPSEPETDPKLYCRRGNMGCVRRYFRRHAACSVRSGGSDTYHVGDITIYGSFLNVTVDQRHVVIGGFQSGRVESLIVDRKTDTTVLTTSFVGLSVNTTKADFTYYRRNRLPKRLVSPITEYYELPVYFTTVFDGVDNLQLTKSYTQTYISAISHFALPCIATSEDPEIKKFYSTLMKNLVPVAQEIFLSRAELIAGVFIQNFICNYGLPYDAFKMGFGLENDCY